MSPERYEKICDVFVEAEEIPRAEQEEFLARICGDDLELKKEVEKMLRSDEISGDFIETPALELIAGFLAEEKSQAKIGQTIGQYKIVSLLGLGGMGEVWLADDIKLKRRVALKLLADVQNKDRLNRFEQEAFAVSALNHPNIITIFDIGETEEHQFIANEFIEGKTLRQLIAEKKLTVSQIVDIALQVCAALATAHEKGIIHRDIKPENIMVRADGITKVLDFGLAKLLEKSNDPNSPSRLPNSTKPGLIVGTVNYMSPEQAHGMAIDEKTDVFSFGIVLYELLANKIPFTGVSEVETLSAILNCEPQPLNESIPEKLRNIISKSLTKSASQRPNASQILEELRQIKRSLDFQDELSKQTTAENLYQDNTAEVTALTDEATLKTGQNRQLFVEKKSLWQPQIVVPIVFLLLLSLITFAYFQSQKKNSASVLKEADKLMIADFENKTGDEEFDKILRQPLAVSLSQSPFLTIVSDGQIQQTLKEMQKKSDEPLSFEIAREICQRRSIKAFLKGTIENRGVEYLLTLETFNAETGESVAKEQTSSKNRETIIASLGEISAEMREKLGESLASIKRLDTPLRESTTNSLDALKSYTLGSNSLAGGKNSEAIPLFKRAIELDPNYVGAYASLANAYFNSGQMNLAAQVMEKAYSLRDRATEREKLKITNFYHAMVTGDMEKNIEALEIFRQLYPRDQAGPHNLSEANTRIGRFDRAAEFARMALNIAPNTALPYHNLGKALTLDSRYDEAKTVFDDAINHKFQSLKINKGLFTIALAKGDEAEMNRQLEIVKAKEPDSALLLQGNVLISQGKWREYEKVMNQAIAEGEKVGADVAADYASQVAVNAVSIGNCKTAQKFENKALKFDQGRAVLQDAALTFSLCGGDADKIISELKEKYPNNTEVQKMWLPIANAALSLKDSPEKTLDFLETTRTYEGGTYFWCNYLRGKAYLKLRKNDLALGEFQKITQNRGWSTHSPLFALAHLELSRLYEAQNDAENSRKFADQFAVMWKSADDDLPIFRDRMK